ncbi:hypothetical protein GCM10007989_14380 [Devosia pacifica]|uniref:PIN domain-containing protein n=1 Tax=Devosia pacifica TaxID=1335967 RepID=A0A918S4U7_9HYPH|nr:PIN domain-containing protein [Devosia pacifica]GHA20445.1 hypothetical protein GCM10007989_14380 [Devosia pacifica]
MTSIIVNDASCLIDLKKGRLLHALIALPYRFIVPLPIRQSELLDFTPQEWRMLEDGGWQTFDLPPDVMTKAFTIGAQYGRLSPNDCFCLATTMAHDEATLLTGDNLLRRAAQEHAVAVHGVLWIIDLLADSRSCEADLLIEALECWRDDRTVFLPPDEIDRRLRSLRKRLR